MIHTVRKTFHFDAAHKIDHHPGKCQHLHGHTYLVTIEATGRVQSQGDEMGMVMDFGNIKQLYNELIHTPCDHRYLNDVFDFPTTAENLAQHFLGLLRIEDRRISAIEISEGLGNIARVTA